MGTRLAQVIFYIRRKRQCSDIGCAGELVEITGDTD